MCKTMPFSYTNFQQQKISHTLPPLSRFAPSLCRPPPGYASESKCDLYAIVLESVLFHCIKRTAKAIVKKQPKQARVVCNKYGGTLLHWAKSKEVINWLLTIQGPDINARSKTGDTALNIMVQQNRPTCALDLIRAGADVNIPDNDGNSPLHHAVTVSKDRGVYPPPPPPTPVDLGGTYARSLSPDTPYLGTIYGPFPGLFHMMICTSFLGNFCHLSFCK